MPLSRSQNKTRNPSRPPIQTPSNIAISQQPFLPPSHYAAAAGVPYYPNPRTENHASSSRNQSDRFDEGVAINNLSTVNGAPRSFVAAQYRSEPETAPRSNLARRSILSIGKKPDWMTSHKRDRSQEDIHPEDIPHLHTLETQLLPTLRDTIHKMTKPGPSTSATASNSSRSQSSDRYLEFVRPTQTSLHTFTSDGSTSVPAPSASASKPRASDMNPEPSASRTNPKPILKSALRTPNSSKIGTPLTDNTHSLRSTKSIATMNARIKQMTKSAKPSTIRTFTHAENDTATDTRMQRARSRTDPGTTMNAAEPADWRAESHDGQRVRTPDGRNKPFVSGLPRYRHAHFESDPESSAETERRTLFVVNATDKSSSGSESDTNDRRRNRQSLRDPAQYGTDPPMTPRSPAATDNQMPNLQRFGRNYGLGLGNVGYGGQDDTIKERIHYPPTNRYDSDSEQSSAIESDVENLGQERIQILPPEDVLHKKRQEALLDIVDSLNFDRNRGRGFTEERAQRDSLADSVYDGQQGLAISSSEDYITPSQKTHYDVHEEGGEYEVEDMSSTGDMEESDSNSRGRYDQVHHQSSLSTMRNSTPKVIVSSFEDYANDRRPKYDFGQGRRRNGVHRLEKTDTIQRVPSPRAGIISRFAEADVERTPRYRPLQSPHVLRHHEGMSPQIPQAKGRIQPVTYERQDDASYSKAPQSDFLKKMGASALLKRGSRDKNGDSRDMALRTSEDTIEASDAAHLAETSYAAAMRECRAFGIPSSMSDLSGDDVDTHAFNNMQISHADSQLSFIDGPPLQENPGELSAGAQTLFRKLSVGHDQRLYGRHSEKDPELRSGSIPERRLSTATIGSQTGSRRSSSSTHSHVSAERRRRSRPFSWRSNLSPEEYHEVLHKYGHEEVERQEIIWEFTDTEEVFSNDLYTILKYFIQPLRVQKSKTWIEGVPMQVARLFDWLEDIVNLHGQLLSVLLTVRSEQTPIVETLASAVKELVPRFEVYQPYLMRSGEVAALIGQRSTSREGRNDFSEFVRIQERSYSDGWTLKGLLLEPVKRLTSYPEIFQRLLNVTPTTHIDYISTTSLFHSMNMVIRVLAEVKERENEYKLVQTSISEIDGIPLSMRVASRERRLLKEGTLYYLSNTPSRHAKSAENSRFPPLQDQLRNNWRSSNGNFDQHSSRGANYGYPSIQTLQGDESSSSIYSEGEYLAKEQPSSGPRFSGGSISSRTSHLSESVNSRDPQSGHTNSIKALVFTDLIILAELDYETGQDRQSIEKWRILDNIGIARVLNVSECGFGNQGLQTSSSAVANSPMVFIPGDAFTIRLDLVPLTSSGLDHSKELDSKNLASIHLSVSSQELTHAAMDGLISLVNEWLTALRRCQAFTLQSLAFPAYAGMQFSQVVHLDSDMDTHLSIKSILGSGLPFPKSPSAQIQDIASGNAEDPGDQEREERGWWSLRFQQVLREIQRQQMTSLIQKHPGESASRESLLLSLRTESQLAARSQT